MLKATLQNYGVIERAEIELEGIVALFGENRKGKSTICRGIGETLTKAKLAPTERTDRPRLGGGASFVKVEDDETGSYIMMTYPANKTEELDWKVKTTAETIGLINPCELPPKKLASLLIDTLKMAPTEAEFIEAVKPAGYAEGIVKKVWSFIEKGGEDGFDKAYEGKVEEGKLFKRDWEKITGKKFAPANGESWMPDGWDIELDSTDVTQASLEKVVETEQNALEDLVKAQGISEAEISELHETFLGLEGLRIAHAEAVKEEAAAAAAYEEARTAYAKLPRPQKDEQPELLTCAHCGEKNIMLHGELAKPSWAKKPDPAQQAKLLADLKAAEEAGAAKAKAAKDAIARLATLEKEIQAAEEAGAKYRNSKVGTAANEQVIAEQRARIETAINRVKMFNLRNQAKTAFEIWKKNEVLIEALSPTGLRKKKLARALQAFNASLEEICNKVNWPLVRIDQDLGITCDGFKYTVESKGGKFLMDAVMAICLAYYRRDRIVSFDGADILVGEGTGKLVRILRDYDMIALVNCARASIDDCKSYRALGLGRSYWIQDGVATEIEDAEETEEE